MRDAEQAGRSAAHPDWIKDSKKWHGRVLTGKHGHWCADWDFLPIDETCDEFGPSRHQCSCGFKDGDR